MAVGGRNEAIALGWVVGYNWSEGDAMISNVSADNERFIAQVIADGRFASREAAIDRAVTLLREDLETNGRRDENAPSAEEWISQLRAWAANHRRVGRPVDFDRGSIYAGRGE